MSKTYFVKKITIDSDEGVEQLIQGKIITWEKKHVFIKTEAILSCIDSYFQIKDKYDVARIKINKLQEQLKDFESKDLKISLLKEKNIALEQEVQEFKNLNQNLQDEITEHMKRLNQQKEQIVQLSTIRGISEKFGTYKSLQKTIEMFLFIYRKRNSVRWLEIIKHFQYNGWAKSTILYHLNTLRKCNIIMTTKDRKGEYYLNQWEDFMKDIDHLFELLVGKELYDLAKESWRM